MSIHSCGSGRDDKSIGGEPIPQRLCYSPAETERLLSISHATLYRLIKAGRLDARKLNGKTVVTAASIERFVAELPKLGERNRYVGTDSLELVQSHVSASTRARPMKKTARDGRDPGSLATAGFVEQDANVKG